MSLPDRVRRAFSENRAETSADAADPRLRGRTYAVPFDDVWRAALGLAEGGLRGWSLVSTNDESGEIVAEARTLVFGFVDDVKIDIVLDADAQTRVDVRSASRVGRADLGANARRIARFFRRLDALLAHRPRRDPLHPAPPA